MRTWLSAVVVASLVSLPSLSAQGRPDFSGTWKMDSSRSESAAQAEPIGPVTLVIAQTPNERTDQNLSAPCLCTYPAIQPYEN